MATQTIEFTAPSGLSLTCRLFPLGSDTQESSDKSATEATNRKGLYTAQWTDAPAGDYTMHAMSGATVVAVARRKLTAATATFRDSPDNIESVAIVNSLAAGAVTASAIADGAIDNATLAADVRVKLAASQPDYAPLTAGAYTAPLDAAGTRTAVGLAAANLDSQFTAIPAAIWAVMTSSLTAAGSIGKLIVDNLNATISSRLAAASYTAPDNAGIAAASTAASNAEAAAESAETAASTAATAAGTAATNTATILARIGAFTGSGLNTILGFLRAMAAKAAGLTPSDLSSGTTFSNTTDSLEANADAGGAGLTEQNIADIAAEVVESLDGSPVTVVSPNAAGGGRTIVHGDTYGSSSGQSISWTNTAALAIPIDAATTAAFTWSIGGSTGTASCTVNSATMDASLSLTASQSAEITQGRGRYKVVWSNAGVVVRSVSGPLIVLNQLGEEA